MAGPGAVKQSPQRHPEAACSLPLIPRVWHLQRGQLGSLPATFGTEGPACLWPPFPSWLPMQLCVLGAHGFLLV